MASDARLSDEAIAAGLAGLEGWSREGDAIAKAYTFPAYMDGITFVNGAAEAAEAADHHPDMAVGYKRVTVTLSTHSSGGISQKDLDLAAALNGLA
ncbi:MAG: 4a-hydroxytetrahydrobiopterin dehydratase [Chloroflexota bacterium]|nr:4a-hydroxytetrahydrobiopterin dehydratase [Chloroflexota bacterium]MDE2899673.1 4a-hydroxytetrahydrobiopterin dehydratase [Chloroflexota bacterium]MDE2968478.1 4a-hydroxytetrahydrobiopterin dehydratase [Chloroflexota bacterium]